MEDEEIPESAVEQPSAEDTSTPETIEEAKVEAAPAKERSGLSFFDAEFLESLEAEEIPEAEVVEEPEADPEPEVIEETHQPQVAVEQEAVETEPEPTPAPATPKEGWPTLAPAPGVDIWGNILVDGQPMIRAKDEATGKWELIPADPETGLTLFTEEDWAELRADDPDLYIRFKEEIAERKSRLGQVLTESRKTEVTQTHEKLKKNGMPETVISAIHTRAEQMLQPFGGVVAPGVYQQAILGATAEMLAFGGDGLIDLARAIIANHEGQAPTPEAKPVAKVEVKPAPKPAAPARLATGGLGATGGAAPVKAAPVAAKPTSPLSDPRVTPDIARELVRLNMTVEEYLS